MPLERSGLSETWVMDLSSRVTRLIAFCLNAKGLRMDIFPLVRGKECLALLAKVQNHLYYLYT